MVARKRPQRKKKQKPGDVSLNMIDELLALFDDPESITPDKRTKARLVSLTDTLRARGWEPGARAGWSPWEIMRTYTALCQCGIRTANLPFAAVVIELLAVNQPETVRAVMYSVVSAGWLPDTSKKSYGKVQRMLKRLRKRGVVPFSWIVDNIRQTVKPSSWSGLEDFSETVRYAYRKNYWAQLDDYPQIICEKDSAAGRIAQVTAKYDVALHPLRGFSSITFAYAIAQEWKRTDKDIYVYYIGDFDPSGMDLERSVRETITRYADGVSFHWKRLAVLPEHFDEFNIIPLAPKKRDTRYKKFVATHGKKCAEVEAIPATQLRLIVRDAIESHIPQDAWNRLKDIEEAEQVA